MPLSGGPDLMVGTAVSLADSSAERIYRLVRRIPHGRATTYGAIGRELGVAARAVGGAMAQCPEDVPWWRVVGAGGAILTAKRLDGTGEEQAARLVAEGVAFDGAGRARLDLCAVAPDELEN